MGYVTCALAVARQHCPLKGCHQRQRQHQQRGMQTVTQRVRARAGFHYCTTLLHKVQMALKLETDPSEVLNELIYCCRKVPCPTLPYGSLTPPASVVARRASLLPRVRCVSRRRWWCGAWQTMRALCMH